MKTRYSPTFLATLERIGMDTQQWQWIARTRHWRFRSRKHMQFARKVQRLVTGKHFWLGGKYV